MRPGAVGDLLAAAARRAGLSPAVTPHQLRHAFGSQRRGCRVRPGCGRRTCSGNASVSSRRCTCTRTRPGCGRRWTRCPARASSAGLTGDGGGSRAAAASAGARRRREFGHVLAGVVLDGDAARLAAMLDRAFLAEAGWDPAGRVLSLPAGHPLLGRTVCRAAGCAATAHGSTGRRAVLPVLRPAGAGRLEPGRRSARRRRCRRCPAGAWMPGSRVPADVAGRAAGAADRAVPGAFAAVPPDPRGRRWKQFLADPRVRPLPALGPCRVAACSRRAESEHGYCPTHYVRWRVRRHRCSGHWPAAMGAGRTGGLRARPGQPARPGTAGGGAGAVRDLAARPRDGREDHRREPAGGLRRAAPPAGGTRPRMADAGLAAGKAGPVPAAAHWPATSGGAGRSCRASGSRHWDLAVFGHPGGLSFTGITQPWLREAVKAWAAEELPRHRGGGAGKVRAKISAAGPAVGEPALPR